MGGPQFRKWNDGFPGASPNSIFKGVGVVACPQHKKGGVSKLQLLPGSSEYGNEVAPDFHSVSSGQFSMVLHLVLRRQASCRHPLIKVSQTRATARPKSAEYKRQCRSQVDGNNGGCMVLLLAGIAGCVYEWCVRLPACATQWFSSKPW